MSPKNALIYHLKIENSLEFEVPYIMHDEQKYSWVMN